MRATPALAICSSSSAIFRRMSSRHAAGDSARDAIRVLVSASENPTSRSNKVLEIGFGPGIAIREAAARASGGLVCGVGHSEVMLGQARRRNAEAIRVGRVDLRLGTAERLPSFDAAFDKVLAVNSMGFGFSEALDHPRGSPPARFTGTPADQGKRFLLRVSGLSWLYPYRLSAASGHNRAELERRLGHANDR